MSIFTGCATKNIIKSNTATIVIKTPTMKFYDKGFINYYDDHVYLQILSAGNVVLDLKVYEDEVCKDALRCMSSNEFNKQYIISSYEENFLYKLLTQNKKEIIFRDRPNGILIKILKD